GGSGTPERPRNGASSDLGSIPVAPAATTAVAATPTAPVAAAAASSAAILLRLGLIDGPASAPDHLAGQPGDGGLGLGVAAQFDEAEPLGPAGGAVHDHLGGLHRPEGGEHLLQGGVRGFVAQVAHVQLLTHRTLQREKTAAPMGGAAGARGEP